LTSFRSGIIVAGMRGLPDTPRDIDKLIIKARRTLWAWRLETRVGLADKPMLQVQVETQVAVLRDLRVAAEPMKHLKIDDLIERMQAFQTELGA
jgi:hypothetical protein